MTNATTVAQEDRYYIYIDRGDGPSLDYYDYTDGVPTSDLEQLRAITIDLAKTYPDCVWLVAKVAVGDDGDFAIEEIVERWYPFVDSLAWVDGLFWDDTDEYSYARRSGLLYRQGVDCNDREVTIESTAEFEWDDPTSAPVVNGQWAFVGSFRF